VCESHDIAGGAAHSFEIKGYEFDSGPSLFSGLSSKGAQANPLAQVRYLQFELGDTAAKPVSCLLPAICITGVTRSLQVGSNSSMPLGLICKRSTKGWNVARIVKSVRKPTLCSSRSLVALSMSPLSFLAEIIFHAAPKFQVRVHGHVCCKQLYLQVTLHCCVIA
jgi:hypothetical protein